MSPAVADRKRGFKPLWISEATANGRGTPGSRVEALAPAPEDRPARPGGSRPPRELTIPQWGNGWAGHGVPADVLLIGSDAARMAEQLRGEFPAHRVQVAATGQAGMEHVATAAPEVIVLDLGLADLPGLEVFRRIRGVSSGVPVIVVAGASRPDAAIAPMREGAFDCLFQPVEPPHLRQAVGAALEVARRLRRPVAAEDPATDADGDSSLLGACPAMGEVYKAIGRVAGQNFPVLITGESGTGKELVARAIYRHGPRAGAPFLAINCAAIPQTLLESELFGHEKGAFTGADRRRLGKFEQCHGGTLFLDEVGDMPPALQAKLLRVLQEQAFERVGGNETVRTDVRVMAATHHDLKADAAAGKFRPDLYYRLGVFTIHLPPLRERGDDLPLLVQHYLRRYNRELGRDVREVAPEALELLRRYPWPGNIRELQNALQLALLQAKGPVLLPAFLPEFLKEPPAADRPADEFRFEPFLRGRLRDGAADLYVEAHQQLDRILLPLVLRSTGGSQVQVAQVLGVARQTLRTKLRELGLNVVRSVEGDKD